MKCLYCMVVFGCYFLLSYGLFCRNRCAFCFVGGVLIVVLVFSLVGGVLIVVLVRVFFFFGVVVSEKFNWSTN